MFKTTNRSPPTTRAQPFLAGPLLFPSVFLPVIDCRRGRACPRRLTAAAARDLPADRLAAAAPAAALCLLARPDSGIRPAPGLFNALCRGRAALQRAAGQFDRPGWSRYATAAGRFQARFPACERGQFRGRHTAWPGRTGARLVTAQGSEGASTSGMNSPRPALNAIINR